MFNIASIKNSQSYKAVKYCVFITSTIYSLVLLRRLSLALESHNFHLNLIRNDFEEGVLDSNSEDREFLQLFHELTNVDYSSDEEEEYLQQQ